MELAPLSADRRPPDASRSARSRSCRGNNCLRTVLAGFALLLAAAPAPGREVDNRPLYFAFLQGLEQGFEAYLSELDEAAAEHKLELEANAASAMSSLRDHREESERNRAEAFEALESSGARLNDRARALNERITAFTRNLDKAAESDAATRRLADASASHREGMEKVAGLQRRYRELALRANEVTAQLEATGVAAQASERHKRAVAALKQGYNARASAVEAEIRRLGNEQADSRQALAAWVEARNQEITEVRESIATDRGRFARAKASHDRAATALRAKIEQFNRLATGLNEGKFEAQAREEAEERARELQTAIASDELELADLRLAAESLAARIQLAQTSLRNRVDELKRQQANRAQAIKRDNETRKAVIDRLTRELADRRASAEEAIAALVRSREGERKLAQASLRKAESNLQALYGVNHVEVYEAVNEWLGGAALDPLLAAAGRSDEASAGLDTELDVLSAAARGAHTAAAKLEQQLGELARASEAASQSQAAFGAISAERAAIERARRTLTARNDALKRSVSATAKMLEEEGRKVAAGLAEAVKASTAYFNNRRELAQLQLTAWQAALLAALDAPRKPADLSRWPMLRAKGSELAARAGLKDRFGLFASMEAIRSRATGTQAPDWAVYKGQVVASSEALSDEQRSELEAIWWSALQRETVVLDRVVGLLPAEALAGGRDGALRRTRVLFGAALRRGMAISRHRLHGGGDAISVKVLDQVRWLRPDGRLEYVPRLDG